jgi:CubicO group peptidase (beta-lactamase class C family)
MRSLLALLLLTAPGFAQSDTYRPPVFNDDGRIERIRATAPIVDSVFQKFFAQRRLPGLVYGVVVDGQLALTGQFGYTNVEKKVPADSKSVFRIASMSKSVTATAIMKLRDEGKVQLDAPAETYLPEMKGLKLLTNDAQLITVRDLLTHGAGFPEDNPWGDRQLADSDQELIDLLRRGISFSNVPGVEFEYANLGFALLGRIVTVVSGMPYQRYTTEKIFKPLGMNSTVWDYQSVPPGRLAHGYRLKDSAWVEEALLGDGAWGAMGGLLTTIEDFGRYVAFHLDAWPPRHDQETGPVRRSSLREMQQPWRFIGLSPQWKYPSGRVCGMTVSYGYGLNWMIDCEGRIALSHGGGLPGFGSGWTMMPDYGIGILSFDNLTYQGSGFVNTAVLDTIISLAKLKPREIPVSSILEQRQQALVTVLPDWKEADVEDLFAENFFPDNDVESWRKHTRELYAKIGAVKHVGPMKPLNQLRGSFEIEGEKGKLSVFFTLTPEKNPMIQQLRIREIR